MICLRPGFVEFGSFHSPDRRRSDRIGGAFARIGSATALKAADRLHLHVVVAKDLTTQPQSGHRGQTPRRQDGCFGFGHRLGFATDERHAAGRAPRVPYPMGSPLEWRQTERPSLACIAEEERVTAVSIALFSLVGVVQAVLVLLQNVDWPIGPGCGNCAHCLSQ